MSKDNIDIKDDREAVLKRLRGDTSNTPDTAAEQQTPPKFNSLTPPSPATRDSDKNTPIEIFEQAALANSATVLQTDSLDHLPIIVSNYLVKNQLENNAVCDSSLLNLAWLDAGIQIKSRIAHETDICGITPVLGADAQTGAMLIDNSNPLVQTLSLLPPHHIAVVRQSTIVPTLSELLQMVDTSRASSHNLIGGPSRTADIEQTLVLGAHGPIAVFIVILRDG